MSKLYKLYCNVLDSRKVKCAKVIENKSRAKANDAITEHLEVEHGPGSSKGVYEFEYQPLGAKSFRRHRKPEVGAEHALWLRCQTGQVSRCSLIFLLRCTDGHTVC